MKSLFKLASGAFFAADAHVMRYLPDSTRVWLHSLAYKAKANYFPSFGRPDLIDSPEVPTPKSTRTGTEKKLPSWIKDEIEDLQRTIDPNLFKKDLPGPGGYQKLYPTRPEPGRALRTIQASIPPNATHFVFAPWIKRGGADLVTIKHLEAICAAGCLPVIFTTEMTESDWIGKIPPSSIHVDLGKILDGLTDTEKMHVLARLVIQERPRIMHNINSNLAWGAIARYGAAMSDATSIFVSLFCDNHIDPRGFRRGYAHDYIPRSNSHIAGYISDNQSYLDLLQSMYGIDPKKAHVVYVSTDSAELNPPALVNAFFWAGRLDAQKRPDILLDVARQLPGTRFDVYGSTLIGGDRKILAALKGTSNVVMIGPYDGFASIPSQEYAGFLYTSAWDGLPNVLLEAGARGIPIVASGVGGVKELISEHTGYLVTASNRPSDYASAIEEVLSNPDEARRRGLALRDIVVSRHSKVGFEHAIRTIPGYL